jgi:glucose/arabinose dehydrogenase
VEAVVGGFDRPSALARLPDGRFLVAEAGGRIRVIEHEFLVERPVLVLDEIDAEGGGRVRLAVAPDFTTSHRVYVAYVARLASGSMAGRIVRYREHGGTLGEPAVVVDGLPGVAGPPGLRLGADGSIYLAAGAGDASDADDLGSYAGKVLRFTADGATPGDNPIPGSPVFCTGYAGRATLDWEPAGRALWHVRTDADGVSVGLAVRGQKAKDVLRIQGATSADAAFHSGDTPSAWHGNMVIASPDQQCLFLTKGLSREQATPTFTKELAGQYGRITAVLSAGDGFYFATANGGTDDRGRPADRVYRVRDDPP